MFVREAMPFGHVFTEWNDKYSAGSGYGVGRVLVVSNVNVSSSSDGRMQKVTNELI